MNRLLNIVLSILFLLSALNTSAQSFNEKETAMLSYVKRMYTASPFEGAKVIEGESQSYYVVAITLSKSPSETEEKVLKKAAQKAQSAAQSAFAEPCIKFEWLLR